MQSKYTKINFVFFQDKITEKEDFSTMLVGSMTNKVCCKSIVNSNL